MTDGRTLQASNLRRFGAAHGARSLGWSVVDVLLVWHLHAKVGLTGAETGRVLFAFLALGGTVTFLVGLAFSRYRATGRTVVRVQLPAAIMAAVLLWVQFRVEDASAVIAAGVVFRIAYAVQDVAQNMLASLLPADAADVRRYARLRVTLSAVTRCCVVAGFALTAATGMNVMLAVIALAMAASALSLRALVFPPRPDVAPVSRWDGPVMPPGLPRLLLGWVIAATLLPTLNRLLVFAPAIEGLPRSGAWLLGGFCLGSVIGPMLRNTVDRSMLLAMVVASGMLMVLPMPIAMNGAWDGTWRVAGALVHGIAVSVIGVNLWSTTSRIAIAEAQRGRSSDGMVFGSVILTIHLASAAGMLVLGPLIEGFEAGRQGVGVAALSLTVVGALLLAGIGISGRTAPAAA